MEAILTRIGWTKRHFAKVVGVNERTVHDWCNGQSEGPAYRIAMKYLELMARLMGC
jgi:DNA-binding XRE family transcriptional regulator